MNSIKKFVFAIVTIVSLSILTEGFAVSKAADNEYKATSKPYKYTYSNGEDGYYLDNDILYHYDYSSGLTDELVKIESKKYNFRNIVTVYGGNVYISDRSDCIDFEGKLQTYVYSISGNAIINTYDGSIEDVSEGYVITLDTIATSVSPYSRTLYKLTPDGMDKVSTFKKSGYTRFIGKGSSKELIYTQYTNLMMQKLSLCKVNLVKLEETNSLSKSRKKLATLKVKSKKYSGMVVDYANLKYCKVFRGDRFYKYTYKTKKYKKI